MSNADKPIACAWCGATAPPHGFRHSTHRDEHVPIAVPICVRRRECASRRYVRVGDEGYRFGETKP